MITISSLIMAIPALVIHNLIPFDYSSRLMAILIMILLGILMAAVYYFVTVGFRLPQEIFETEDVSLRSLLRRLRR